MLRAISDGDAPLVWSLKHVRHIGVRLAASAGAAGPLAFEALYLSLAL